MAAIDRIKALRKPFDLDRAAEEHGSLRRYDRALIGKSRDGSPPSSISVREDGTIEIFTGDGIGIRVNPALQSMTIFAPRLQIYVDELDIQTKPMAFRWNQFPLNLKPMFTGMAPTGPVTTEGTLMPYTHLPEAIAGAISRLGRGLI